MPRRLGSGRHAVGDRRFVDETYVKVNGSWRYVYWAVDQHGQVIDVLVSKTRELKAAKRFLAKAIAAHGAPCEVRTDKGTSVSQGNYRATPGHFA